MGLYVTALVLLFLKVRLLRAEDPAYSAEGFPSNEIWIWATGRSMVSHIDLWNIQKRSEQISGGELIQITWLRFLLSMNGIVSTCTYQSSILIDHLLQSSRWSEKQYQRNGHFCSFSVPFLFLFCFSEAVRICENRFISYEKWDLPCKNFAKYRFPFAFGVGRALQSGVYCWDESIYTCRFTVHSSAYAIQWYAFYRGRERNGQFLWNGAEARST